MIDMMEKIEKLLLQYEGELSEKGLSYSVSKKYFEEKTPSTSFRHHDTLEIFLRHLALKRENKSFNHQRNRFHSAVICFYPSEKGVLKKIECREYAFVLYEISRHEEGYAPKKRKHKEEKILKKIEKKIKKVLKSAEKKDAVSVCKETKADIIRYFFLRAYGYKKTVAGVSRDTLDLFFSLSFFVLLWIVVFIVFSKVKQ